MSIPASSQSTTARAARTRWPAIDALRGAALVAMIIYHFAWDLRFHFYIATDIASDPLWSRFAMGIAASFLFLVGVGFAFAARCGLNRESYLRRLVMVGGAAILVSLATAFAMPDAPVLFGILHCIALASVLILPFLRAPVAATAALGIIVIALPNMFRGAAFDGRWWSWLGLAENNPPMVDHVPILPWSGFVLIGLAIGRLVLENDSFVALRERLRGWAPASPPTRLLALMGRWSLVIYLTHQIVLNALLWPFAPGAAPPRVADEAASFRNACLQTCQPALGDSSACRAYCDCATAALQKTPMWASILRDRLSPEEQSKVSEIARQCAPGNRPGN